MLLTLVFCSPSRAIFASSSSLPEAASALESASVMASRRRGLQRGKDLHGVSFLKVLVGPAPLPGP